MYEKSVGQISIIAKQDMLVMAWLRLGQSFIEISGLENWYSDFHNFHEFYFEKYQLRNFHREIDTSLHLKSLYDILRSILFHMSCLWCISIQNKWVQSCATNFPISGISNFRDQFSSQKFANYLEYDFAQNRNFRWDQSDHSTSFDRVAWELQETLG